MSIACHLRLLLVFQFSAVNYFASMYIPISIYMTHVNFPLCRYKINITLEQVLF